MTTLFNTFCPFFGKASLLGSMVLLISISLSFSLLVLKEMLAHCEASLSKTSSEAYPVASLLTFLVFFMFFFVMILNLLSLVVYSFPVTTTLSFNLSAALSLWLSGVLLQSTKRFWVSAILPENSPWYLIPFLSMVELVSVLVRPLTLCFRLLANMSAGHILLSLITKIPSFWALGVLFGLLELMVSVVQAFVFLMLVGVYLEEAWKH